ncbi:MAG: hypothetical protein II368_04780 [Clostridia bacterium]|nr:hypothetical protein [Clostridia bacterium]
MVLFYVLIAAFLIAINFYGLTLIRYQRLAREEGEEGKNVSDGKLFTVAFLGGTLAIYIFMMIKKYRLKSIALVVGLPLVFILNAYFVYFLITSGLGIFPLR